MPPTIVVDTNVLLGAALGPTGPNRMVVRACMEGRIQAIVTDALFHEYCDIWARREVWVRSRLPAAERADLLESFVNSCSWVRVHYRWRPNLSDEGDNHIIDLAVAGRASHIVTNNVRDFAGAELRFPSIRVVDPERMIEELASWPQ